MTFAGINYLAVLIAAAAGFGVGMPWYMAFAKPWMAANGLTKEKMAECQAQARRGRCRSSLRSSPASSWPGCWPA